MFIPESTSKVFVTYLKFLDPKKPGEQIRTLRVETLRSGLLRTVMGEG